MFNSIFNKEKQGLNVQQLCVTLGIHRNKDKRLLSKQTLELKALYT
jgi:hypothetical protein